MSGSDGSTEDLVADMRRLYEEAAATTAELSRVSSHVLEKPRAGSDSTRSATVTIGTDGLPMTVDIASDWKRRLKGSRLDSAVVEAATTAYMSGWVASFHEVEAEKKRGIPTEIPPLPVYNCRQQDSEPEFEDVWRQLQDTISMLDELGSAEPPPPMTRSVKREHGNLSVTLTTAGLTDCHIDEAWAKRQPLSKLIGSLNAAMSEARSQVVPAQLSNNADEGMADLFGSVMSLFNTLAYPSFEERG